MIIMLIETVIKYILSPFIAALIAAIITSLCTYVLSIRYLKQKIKIESVEEFLKKYYWPLLGELERVNIAINNLSFNGERSKIGLTEDEMYHIYLEKLSTLSQILDSIIKSGAASKFRNVNVSIYNNIMSLDNLINCNQHQSEANTQPNHNVTEGIMQIIIKLNEELLDMTKAQLIIEYQRTMNKNNLLNKNDR